MSTFKLSSMSRQLETIKSFRSDGKMDFDMGKCESIQRVKEQLTVTDRFTVHEHQIIEVQCSQYPRKARLCYQNERLILWQLE